MSKQAAIAACLLSAVLAAPSQSQAQGKADGPMCTEPRLTCRDVAIKAAPEEVDLLIRRNSVQRAFLREALRADEGEEPVPGGPVRYSISDNMRAAMSYSHAFLFDTASNDELRTNRFGSFSTARERDVLGLGMDWGVNENNVVGFGYQLQSVRPDRSTASDGGGGVSILPGSDGVDHTFMLGVTRSWGGNDSGE